MADTELARFFEIAVAPFAEGDHQLVQKVAYLVGYDGFTLDEAAQQLDVDVMELRDTLAFDPHFQGVVDRYRAAQIRELEGRARQHLVRRLELAAGADAEGGVEITAGEARLQRAVQSLHKDVMAGERETARLRQRRAERELDVKSRAVRSDLKIISEEPLQDLEGVHGGEPEPELEV